MKPEIKELWIAALESGDYQKGKGQLRSYEDKFCCLGVLCNLHAQAHPEIAATQMYSGYYLNSCASLPEEVCIWSGISYSGSYGNFVEPNGRLESLASINDCSPTFEPVIKAIKEYF